MGPARSTHASTAAHPAAPSSATPAALAPPSGAGPGASAPLDAEGCVELALRHSGKVGEAWAQLEVHQARLDGVVANLYPKLTAMSLLAPAYTVRGNGYDQNPQVRWRSIRDWGPYTNFEARFIQPVSTFGRLQAGRQAARERVVVEQHHVREVEQAIARQVRQLYYTTLYVESLRPALAQAGDFVELAVARAQRAGQSGHVEVSQSDLGRLVHGQSELLRRRSEAEEGAALSRAALAQAMGITFGEELQLYDARLPMPLPEGLAQVAAAEGPLPEWALGHLPAPLPPSAYALQLQVAAANRPEWQQLLHGQRAAVALERSERAAMLPRLLVVGQFMAAWTPTREHDRNPWHYDIYNRLAGGAALVLQLDLDVAQARAKAREAAAQGTQLRALQHFAAQGIPLEVRQAFEGLRRARRDLEVSQRDLLAARRWFAFAKAALVSNTGEARDALEGLAAYVQARQSHLAAALAWWLKLADLTHATGAATPPWLPPKNSSGAVGHG